MLPSLFAGLFADDFSHAVLINNPGLVLQPDNLSFFHLFSFITEDASRREQLQAISALPWWVNQEFKLVFFRPLAELSHYIDYRWIKTGWLMHLHSLLWYALLLFLVAKVYQQFCGDKNLAILAFLFFVVDATHAFTVAWLANRNAVMAAVFSMAAILLHHQSCIEYSFKKRIASTLCIACSFLSAEVGITVGVFLFFYALILDKDGWMRSLLKLWPALLVFIAWALIYRYYGYGASGNKAYYVNLITMPGFYLENFLQRFPQAMAIQFNLLPLHLIGIRGGVLTAIGLFASVVLLLFVFKQKQKSLTFFFAVTVLSIVPIASAEVQERNMLFVGIAASPLLAALILYLLHMVRNTNKKIIAILASSSMFILLCAHLFLSALIMLPSAYGPRLFAQPAIDTALSLPDDIEDKHIISFGTPLFQAGFLSAIRWTAEKPIPNRFWNVATHIQGGNVKRIDEHSLLVSREAGLLGGLDFLLRDQLINPLTPGEKHLIKGLTIEIVAVNKESVPIQLKITSPLSLNDETIKMVFWKHSKLVPMTLAVGEEKLFD